MNLTSDKISLNIRIFYSFDSIIVPLTFLIIQPPKVTLNEDFKFINLIGTKPSFKLTLGGCVIKKVNGTVLLSKE